MRREEEEEQVRRRGEEEEAEDKSVSVLPTLATSTSNLCLNSLSAHPYQYFTDYLGLGERKLPIEKKEKPNVKFAKIEEMKD